MQKFVQRSISSALLKEGFADCQDANVNSLASLISEKLIAMATTEVGESTSPRRDVNIRVSQLKSLLLCGISNGGLTYGGGTQNIDEIAASALSLVKKERERKKEAEAMFLTIRNHHDHLRVSDINECPMERWGQTTSRTSTLKGYCDAASSMGEREWVKEGILWCSIQAQRFFFEGGWVFNPRRISRRWKNKRIPLSKDVVDLLERRNQASIGLIDAPRALRLLDVCTMPMPFVLKDIMHQCISSYFIHVSFQVGSCYNPFVTTVPLGALDVTAIDLCPLENTGVLRCDFLTCSIAENDANTPQVVESYDDGVPSVVCLSAGSFDVVVMSLVLSYLPDPMMRAEMISRAYDCLSCPSNSDPSKGGLLLLVDKGSISTRRDDFSILGDWVSAIESQGFSLVRCDTIRSKGTAHALAFQTIPRDSGPQLIPIPIKTDCM